MAGIMQDNIIYPVLDLIRREIKNYNTVGNNNDVFDGEPSIILYREDVRDSDRVTGADLTYESGWMLSIFLKYGTDDPNLITVSESDYNYIFQKYDRLYQVIISTLNIEGETVVTFNIRLNYDNEGRFTGTEVNRIYS